MATEESLDLDMVSAICPRCRILLVEAASPSLNDLAIAVSTSAFTDHGAHRITVVDPGPADAAVGASFSLRLTAFDTSRAAARKLQFTATGAPSGLTIRRIPRSTNAMISGTLPSAPGTFHVTVNAHDGRTVGTTHFMIAVVPSLAPATATPGEVSSFGPKPGVFCLDAGGGGTGSTVKISACDSSGSGQKWLFTAGAPGDSGQLSVGGLCLGLPSPRGKAVLAACSGRASQRWKWPYNAELRNQGTGTCLSGSGRGSTARGLTCFTTEEQSWELPTGQITSGASADPGQLCLDNPGNAAKGKTPATVAGCVNSTEQQWTNFLGVISATGLCLTAKSSLPETPVVIAKCTGGPGFGQDWRPYRNGELVNDSDNLCLADPAGGGPGTALIQQDCYDELGEIWGLS